MRTASFRLTLRRYGWVMCAGALVGVSAGVIANAVAPTVYESTTSVLVQPVPGQPTADVNLETEAQLATSTQTAEAAANLLGRTRSARDLVNAVTVDTVANTPVLVLHVVADNPQAAQDGAHAVAKAYLANREQAARTAVTTQTSALTKKINESTTSLEKVNARIAALPKSSAELAILRTSQSTLDNQISSLTTKLNELTTTPINPGRVIRDAELPGGPRGPQRWLFIILGAAAGLVIGAAVAALGQRISRRVHDATDVTQRAGIAMLAQLPADLPGSRAVPPLVFAPQHAIGRAFHRLRNEVVAALEANDRLLLVTGASSGPASTLVAANLAAALARADNDVVLVGANVPDLGRETMLLSHVFDIADVPGLTDVLTRRTELTAALQKAPRTPRLRVVAPGGTASAAGLLQSEAVRTTFRSLRGQARYVVVDAPSTAAGADAQSLARLCDVAILVVEVGRTGRSQVADAAIQLNLVGTRMLGAVVVPPIATPEAEPEEHAGRAMDDMLRESDAWVSSLNAPTQVQPPVPTPDQAVRRS